MSERMRGGRAAAEAALAKVKPAEYARSRNFLDGAVTRLSPYLRHGVLTLAEVRDHVLERVQRASDAEKLVNELGWRDYWQRLYALLGDDVWWDLETYKTGWGAESYAQELPAEISEGTTGLACMDGFAEELRETGYLHNHARMWVAAYVVHWRRVRWQAGAKWFLEHLLDGDPASNNLSWQWVASTFSHKPYFFNRENLERYTGGRYCVRCAMRDACPLQGSYEALEQKLFPQVRTVESAAVPLGRPVRSLRERAKPSLQASVGEQPLLWVHTDALHPRGEVLTRFTGAAAVFVWDEGWLEKERISRGRVGFLEECLAEMPEGMEVRRGDVAAEVLAVAKEKNADCVVAMRTVDPRLLEAARKMAETLRVVWMDVPPFVDEGPGFDLKRFSRYWQKARDSAMRPGAGGR
jgi:deoxyribodipyrimidine photo-lyase